MMDFREFISKQEWIFSKTYAEKAPHEYCLREKVVGSDLDFLNAVKCIRDNGFKAEFWRKEHIYLQCDGKLYWTMGAPINETILINRCNMDDYKIIMMKRKDEDGNNLQGK